MTAPDPLEPVTRFLDAAEQHARYALGRAQAALEGAEAEAARDYHAEAGRLQADADLKAEHARQAVAAAGAEVGEWARRGGEAGAHASAEGRETPSPPPQAHGPPAGARGGRTGGRNKGKGTRRRFRQWIAE